MSILLPRAELRRRGLLFGAASLALTASVARAKSPAWSLPDSAWKELSDAMAGGSVVRPNDPGYSDLTRCYNLAYPTPRPAGIAKCASAANVQAALKWCGKHGVQPTARSGGHSYAGFSMADGLMINTRGMTNASFDPRTKQVRIDGGTLNQDVYDILARYNVAITHGRCPTVGAAGFLLGGGIGFAMREHGVAADQMLETQVVTAAGDLLTASANQNNELFWACRGGGGGNFGINTSFTLQTHDVSTVTWFHLTWNFKTSNQITVAATILEEFTKAPDGLGSRLSVKARASSDQTSIDLIGQFTGDPGQLKAIMARVRKAGQPASEEGGTLPYWEAQNKLKDTDGFTAFHERSAFLAEGLGPAAWTRAEQFLNAWPATGGSADLRFFQTGGQMNRLHPLDTAFVHRHTNWLMDIGMTWEDTDTLQQVEAGEAWQNAFYAAMLPHTTGGAYQNFIDPAEYNWAQAYYGKALPRLRQVKRTFDPQNIFHFPQSIPG